MKRFYRISAVAFLLALTGVSALAQFKPSVLTAEEVKKAVPKDYYYRGQSASVQVRNAAGIKASSDGKMVLAGLVDTSGYAADVQAKYMGLFVTEIKLSIGDASLVPGQYGFGFTKDGKFVISDVGANQIVSASFQTDDNLKRPVPLQITQEGDGFRLYQGKHWVSIKLQ
jgi:hypothetical protein